MLKNGYKVVKNFIAPSFADYLKNYFPQENDIILFTGKHYMKRPSNGRRIILISTIFEYNKNND